MYSHPISHSSLTHPPPPPVNSFPRTSPIFFSSGEKRANTSYLPVEGREKTDSDEFYRKMLYSNDFEDYCRKDKPIIIEKPRLIEESDYKFGVKGDFKKEGEKKQSNEFNDFENFENSEKGSQIRRDPCINRF
jgi:hypothetical protein